MLTSKTSLELTINEVSVRMRLMNMSRPRWLVLVVIFLMLSKLLLGNMEAITSSMLELIVLITIAIGWLISLFCVFVDFFTTEVSHLVDIISFL